MEQADTRKIEREALIFNVQKYNMYDSPGIHTIMFFKGCPLRCKWYSNPEGLDKKVQIMSKKNSHTDCGTYVNVCPMGIHVLSEGTGTHMIRRDIDRVGCCKCKDSCPQSALEITGETKAISQLLRLVEEDSAFYKTSGGGVTLSGGECTSQPETTKSLLMVHKEEGIDTAIETYGHVKTEKPLQIVGYMDLFLYDIKHMDPIRHNELAGISNELTLSNLNELLRHRHNVEIRVPMLRGINDSREGIDQIIQSLPPYRDSKNFEGVDLLPYYKTGANKYEQLDKPCIIEDDPSLSREKPDWIEGWVREYSFPVKVVRH